MSQAPQRATIKAEDLAQRKAPFKIIDIRKAPDDLQIPGSIIRDGSAIGDGSDVPFDKDDDVVLYCGSGNSCARIAGELRERGYRTVALEGGYKAWVDAGLPTETAFRGKYFYRKGVHSMNDATLKGRKVAILVTDGIE